MIRLIDVKFRAHKAKYALQCLLAAGAMAVILLVLDFFSNAAIIAALGASSFIAFATPKANVSRPRYLLGGYLMGIVAGSLCWWLWQAPWVGRVAMIPEHPNIVPGAVAIGLAIFLMAVTNTEHPPAASVALGLVLGEWQVRTVLVIAAGIVALTLVKTLLKPIMMDLVEVVPRGPSADKPDAAPAGSEGDVP